MPVQRIGLRFASALSLSFILGACSNNTMNGVFPNTQQETGQSNPDACSSSSLIQNRFIVKWADGHTSVESGENAETFKRKFIAPRMGKITHVEFDQKLHIQQEQTPAASPNVDPPPNWGQDIVQASSAWNAGINGQGVLVGVVDAAVDYTHPQIKPRLAANLAEVNGKSGIDDDGNGFIDDLYGWDFEQNVPDPHKIIYPMPVNPADDGNIHGTHVSGIIAADHKTGKMQGIAPEAQIVPANFMDSSGSGSLGAAIQAIEYVSSRGVKVINASWGGSSCSQALKTTIAGLAAKNILFVVASGNDFHDLDMVPDYPANFTFDHQITVAASNSNDILTAFSNNSYNFVHLGAPGQTIYSTIPGPAGYKNLDGTSMATPFVTGTAALLWSLRPNATYAQIKQAILAGTDYRSFRVKTQGRLNISNSINALKQMLPQ